MGSQGLPPLGCKCWIVLYGGGQGGPLLKTKNAWTENPQGAFGYSSHDSEPTAPRGLQDPCSEPAVREQPPRTRKAS